MQLSFKDGLEIIVAAITIIAGVGALVYRVAKHEARVQRLEEIIDEILPYFTRKFRRPQRKNRH